MSNDPVERIESDSLGDIAVPADAYWGAQTQRAVQNFPISNRQMDRRFIRALGIVKKAAATANRDLETIPEEKAEAIRDAATEVIDGEHDDQFPVDVFQTGSGTSTNMNANEVIANRASELLGAEVGSKHVHPNDHVNFGQSSNDVIPTVMHVASLEAVEKSVKPALEVLRDRLVEKETAYDDVVKTGRTHLQDATPVRLGQEFGGYRTQIEKGIDRIERVKSDLAVLSTLGSETRYRLARILADADGELCVCELNAIVDVSKSAISHALTDLRQAGLVTRRKDGRWRKYEATPVAAAVIDALDDVHQDE